jgi:hypothetical protein
MLDGAITCGYGRITAIGMPTPIIVPSANARTVGFAASPPMTAAKALSGAQLSGPDAFVSGPTTGHLPF